MPPDVDKWSGLVSVTSIVTDNVWNKREPANLAHRPPPAPLPTPQSVTVLE